MFFSRKSTYHIPSCFRMSANVTYKAIQASVRTYTALKTYKALERLLISHTLVKSAFFRSSRIATCNSSSLGSVTSSVTTFGTLPDRRRLYHQLYHYIFKLSNMEIWKIPHYSLSAKKRLIKLNNKQQFAMISF